MQEMLQCRCQQDGSHRQEEKAAEDRIEDRKYFGRRRHHGIDRAHAGQDHRSVERGVQPRQAVKIVIADRANRNGHRQEPDNDDAVAGEALIMSVRAAGDGAT